MNSPAQHTAPTHCVIPVNNDLFTYVVRQADNCMVLCQRLCEWSAKAPELEEDLALTNIGLDLIGQARSLYQYAAEIEGTGRSEDDLAFMRNERDWYNALLVELPNGNFADTMARQFFYDAWHIEFLNRLQQSTDKTLAAVAAKSVKEATYHLRHSSNWVIRLGDGTDESHQKMQTAIDNIWRYTGELNTPDELDEKMASQNIGVDLSDVRSNWETTVDSVLTTATITRPEPEFQATGGRTGLHTTDMGYLLGEMQVLHRSYPGCEW